MHVDHGVCRPTGLREVGDEDRPVLGFADHLELLIPSCETHRAPQ